MTTSTGNGLNTSNTSAPTAAGILSSVESAAEAPFNLVSGIGKAGEQAATNLAAAVNTQANAIKDAEIIVAVGAALALIVFALVW